MKLKFLITILLSLFVSFAYSQVSITNAAPSATINFSNSMQPSVGSTPSTAYEGDGFAPNPTTPGRLNSNAWEVKGWSFGNLLFGGTQTVDDFARGPVTGGVITPGMYAYTESPGTVANPAMLIQPSAGDFDPGTVALKIKNNGTSNMTQISVNYNLFVLNDENSSSAFNFSHSPDNLVYEAEPLLDYTSPDVADAFQWVNIGIAPSRTIIITGLNIAPGGFYYIRWSSFLVSGTGASDEFGLDDIVIMGTYGAAAPEINVVAYGATVLSGDTTPTVGEGTEFAPSYSPLSTLLTTLQITYQIQNLGGLPLTISNVTITGANAADFSFTGNPVGVIPAADVVISSNAITIVFDPSLPGLRTARLNIFSDDSNENPYWFNIQGYGIIPIPDIRINGGGAPGGGSSIVSWNSMVPNVNNNTLYNTPQIVGSAGIIHPFVIRNDCPYNAPVILTDPSPYITFSGNHPADFSLVAIPSSANINPGFTRTFSIRFSPTAPGIRNAIVTIPNNDPDEAPFTFLVQGTGVAPEMDVTGNTQPIISGSTTTSFVNHTFFDNLNINTGTLDRIFTIKNPGNVALTIGALTISGPNAADFSVITAPPASLAIAGTTTFTIRFDPSAVGLRTATVSIINNDPNENPYTFAISGYGLDYIPCSFGALETIAQQDFEAAPAAPIWNYTATGTSVLAGGTAFGATGDSGATNKFIGARSLQVSGGTATVTMNNINTTQYSDIELNLRLGSFSTTALEGADVADRVLISVNSGGPWSNEIDVLGNTNTKWSFGSGTGIATVPFDDNNVVASFSPGAVSFATADGYGTISISGLPKVANLSIRITVSNNSAAEIWALDNVTLFGRKELSTTWTTAWSAGAPTSSVKAIIDGDYDTALHGGSINSCKCEIKAGRTVTIGANSFLDVQSEIENSGTLTIEDRGSLVQRNDLAPNIGIVKVKRYTTFMRQYDYTYWSSPVIGQTLSAISPNTLADKYFSFSPTLGLWTVIMNGATTMLPGKGYIVRAPQTFNATLQQYTGAEFNGAPNNGFIQTPITIGVSNMNLIGNPYPSAINADLFLGYGSNTGVVEGTIYLWTHNTAITNFAYNANDYAVYNLTGTVSTRAALNPGVNNTTPTKFIASGQSFFIKGLAAGQATFNNSMRVSGNNTGFFRPGNFENATNIAVDGIEKNRIWLNLSNSDGAFKQTLVGYIEGATNAIDRSFDGELFNANAFVSLYSILDGKNMAIQGRALPFHDDDKVILGYNSTLNGIFEISIDNVDGIMTDQNIYLEDRLLNVIHDLKQSPYSFNTAIGTFDTRFELRYTTNLLATDNFSSAGNALLVAVNKKNINILSQGGNMKSVTVYDLLGRNIFDDQKVNSDKFTINNVISSQQALIVKIVLENGKIVTRKVVL